MRYCLTQHELEQEDGGLQMVRDSVPVWNYYCSGSAGGHNFSISNVINRFWLESCIYPYEIRRLNYI